MCIARPVYRAGNATGVIPTMMQRRVEVVKRAFKIHMRGPYITWDILFELLHHKVGQVEYRNMACLTVEYGSV